MKDFTSKKDRSMGLISEETEALYAELKGRGEVAVIL